MGRMIPLDDDPIIKPAMPMSLMVAGMAATIAIITGLCGFRRKTPPPLADKSDFDNGTSNNEANAAAETTLSPPQHVTTSKPLETEEETEEFMKELPLPPGLRAVRQTYSSNNLMPKSASTQNLNFSFSVRHSRSISMNKIREKVIKPKPANQDSLWKKTIILGGKCKLDDLGLDQDGESVTQNGKGDRIVAHHPRSMSAASLSRMTSFREPDTIPDQNKEKGITRQEEEEDS